MEIKLLNFKQVDDKRGSLVAIEGEESIPFSIKRIYYIYGVPADSSRGCHAHKNLKQVLICLKGSCRIKLDNGEEQETLLLNHPACGLLLDGLIWREMFGFSESCVLLILASDHYDPDDYIWDYKEFVIRAKQSEGDLCG